MIKYIVVFIVLLSSSDYWVLTIDTRQLQQNDFKQTTFKAASTLPSSLNKNGHESVSLKSSELTYSSSHPDLFLRQKSSKRSKQRSTQSHYLNHNKSLLSDSIYSCLSAEEIFFFEITKKINDSFSFLYLIKTLDSKFIKNITKYCSFKLYFPNVFSHLIKPFFLQNITHLQTLSTLVSQSLKSTSGSYENLLRDLFTSFKSNISSEYKSLKIVLKTNGFLRDFSRKDSMLKIENEQNTRIYIIFKNILNDSKYSSLILCKKSFLALTPQLPLLWGNITYNGSSNSWWFVVHVPVIACHDRNQYSLRGFIEYQFSLDMLEIGPCKSTHPSSIFNHKCPFNSKCIAIKDKRNTSLKPYKCACDTGLCLKTSQTTKTDESCIGSRDIYSQFIKSVFDAYKNYNKQTIYNSYIHSRNYNKDNNLKSLKNFKSQIFSQVFDLNLSCVPCISPQNIYRSIRSNNDNTNNLTDSLIKMNHTEHSFICDTRFNVFIRGIPLALEALTLTICLGLMIAVFKNRKTKMIKVSIWLLLETIVFGCFLINIAVILRYFGATTSMCIMMPWFREVGFTVVYGSLIFKVYKVLAEFQSRKAHRAQVRDKDLLKGLFVMVVVVVGYMAAWTAVTIDSEVNLNYIHSKQNLHKFDLNPHPTNANHQYIFTNNLLKNQNLSGYNHTKLCSAPLKNPEWSVVRWNRVGDSVFTLCRCAWWDVVIEIVEVAFLCWGLRLCYRARTAPSIHHEVSSITIVIINELIISILFHTIKYWMWLRLHSDYLFLMYFLRAQLTTSPLLLVIFAPKLWYINKGIENESLKLRGLSCSDVPENQESVKLNATSYGEVDVSEIRIEDMSSDDIRSELKRVYTQLEMYKTKSLRQDNPHISRKKGGKKQTHRRFSLQTFHNKHKRPTITADADTSKTPEESINSAERGSVCIEDVEIGNRKNSFKKNHSKTNV